MYIFKVMQISLYYSVTGDARLQQYLFLNALDAIAVTCQIGWCFQCRIHRACSTIFLCDILSTFLLRDVLTTCLFYYLLL